MTAKKKATPRQEYAAPLTPRTGDGRCGTCAGLLAYDEDLSGDKCQACGRIARPPPPPTPPTPEEIRARVLAELSTMAEGLDPTSFWQTFILVNEVATIIGMNGKAFRQWARLNGFELVTKRNPNTGKRAAFMEVETAKAIIRFRM